MLLTLTAALLATPPASAAPIDFQGIAGLPRAGTGANGSSLVWRNLGLRAQSEWIDAEITVPTCLAITPLASGRGDSHAPACQGVEAIPSPIVSGDHDASITFKVPRWDDRFPWVDLSLRQWRLALIDGPGRTGRSGATGAVVLRQPLAGVDGIVGYEQPVSAAVDSSRWRTLFVGLAWRSSAGVALEIIGERRAERASGAVDRSLELRLARRFDIAGARVLAWGTRSFDAAPRGWRSGVGMEFPF